MDTLYFKGVVKFASTSKLDNYGSYSITISLDPNDIPKFNKSGIQKTLKLTDDGPTVTFKRKAFINTKSGIKELGAPSVYDKNGALTDFYPSKGDNVTCKISVYSTIKGPGCSLEAIILNDKEGTWSEREKHSDPEYDGIRV